MTKELLSVNENLGKINADDYANNFNDIDKVMKNNNSVKNIWLDFCSSLTTASLEDDKKRRYAITSAGGFFRFSTITQSINVAYWKNFGGIFTGIGIFGTFLGLTIGLLGVDLTTSDTAALKEGIGNLLSGISVAFGTSLIGIFCALLYGGFYKYYTDKFNSVIDDLKKEDKNIASNGTFSASSGFDGLGTVVVDVPERVPVVESIDITANGTYTPPQGVDGFNNVVVNVPSSGGGKAKRLELNNGGQ